MPRRMEFDCRHVGNVTYKGPFNPCWSLAGLKVMLAVCRHREDLKHAAFTPFSLSPAEKPVRAQSTKPDRSKWLQAKVPVLHLVHKNRPWAQVLRCSTIDEEFVLNTI